MPERTTHPFRRRSRHWYAVQCESATSENLRERHANLREAVKRTNSLAARTQLMIVRAELRRRKELPPRSQS